jgi:hypothetical protein
MLAVVNPGYRLNTKIFHVGEFMDVYYSGYFITAVGNNLKD